MVVVDHAADFRPPIPLEDVARVALELAAERELGPLLARFIETVRDWAAPSAVLAAVQDPGAESGWRLLPVLSAGSGPLGAERSLPQLVQDAPQCLERPTLLKPRDEVPGVRPRDNCVVPWWHEGQSGILVLRGVPRPCPANLPEAVALVSAPVWPRLLGGPAERVESSVAELGRLADRLREDVSRQVERLHAARAEPSSAPPGTSADGQTARARLVELEREAELARSEARGASVAREELAGRVSSLEQARERAEESAREARESLVTSARELGEARQESQRLALELEDYRDRVSALESALRDAEAARDRLRSEVDELSSRPEPTGLRDEGAAAPAGDERREVEEERRRIGEERREVETRRREAEELVREAAETRRAAEEGRHAAEDALTLVRQQLAEARQESQRWTLESGRLGDRVASLEPSLRDAEGERDRLRGEVERLSARLESLRADLAAATEQAEERRREAEEARAGARRPDEAVAAAGRAATSAPTEPATAGMPGAAAAGASGAVEALRGALAVLRRTPFVPPALRVTLQEAEAVVTNPDERKAPWLRVVLLDRDAASLEPLAAELEDAGLDVRIANYPEELALLMKTPDARSLNAVVCDVLAFRPDQNVAGLFRSWQKDRPSLALYLSFGADNPTETERAQRVPLSLTEGRFRRPLVRQDLIEMLTPLARRQETS